MFSQYNYKLSLLWLPAQNEKRENEIHVCSDFIEFHSCSSSIAIGLFCQGLETSRLFMKSHDLSKPKTVFFSRWQVQLKFP